MKQSSQGLPNSIPTQHSANNLSENTLPQPQNIRKRRPNASGNRTTSVVWEHFNRVEVAGGSLPEAACKYCGKRFYCHPKIHGTSSMSSHLIRCTKYTHSISSDPTQRILSFGTAKSGGCLDLKAVSQRFNVQECRKALTMFVILDEQPFRIVDGVGFKILCKQLQPQFSPPSRHTIARDCFQLYLDEKIKLKSMFRDNTSRVSLTTDRWTSIQNLNYLAVTAHFVDSEWRYQKKIISFSIVPNHKGDTIGRKVEDVLREWGLMNVFSITVDNASSNDVAVTYLKKRLNSFNALVLNGEFFHMRCCAHILNLVVTEGLMEKDTSISTIRNAVRFVMSSPQRMAKFEECIAYANVPAKKLVCLDVPTRWNSTYAMLESAVIYQSAFEKLGFEDPTFRESFGAASTPSSSDWDNAKVFLKFLKFFYNATRVFSASTQVTLHSAFHQLAMISCELDLASTNLNTILATMGYDMKKIYDKYWGGICQIDQLLYFGVILDPRFKFNYVEWSFNDMYAADTDFANEISYSVKLNMSRMYQWYAALHEQKQMVSQSVQPSTQSSSFDMCPKEDVSHSARTDAFKQHLRSKNSIDAKNELERYLSEACVDADDNFDILQWWKLNSSRFPILSKMVRDVLSTPVSTVASESAFSTGGRVLDSFRSSLTPGMVEALICAQNWLKPSDHDLKDSGLGEDLEISHNVLREILNSKGPLASASTPSEAGSAGSQPDLVG